mmetsp:Transcript_23678/g.74460  ORF Transcript_23678/g.74460 Transcript_23678/m.74460 type:complete len:273 (+) Transcript_23678:587-1405(+)
MACAKRRASCGLQGCCPLAASGALASAAACAPPRPEWLCRGLGRCAARSRTARFAQRGPRPPGAAAVRALLARDAGGTAGALRAAAPARTDSAGSPCAAALGATSAGGGGAAAARGRTGLACAPRRSTPRGPGEPRGARGRPAGAGAAPGGRGALPPGAGGPAPLFGPPAPGCTAHCWPARAASRWAGQARGGPAFAPRSLGGLGGPAGPPPSRDPGEPRRTGPDAASTGLAGGGRVAALRGSQAQPGELWGRGRADACGPRQPGAAPAGPG